MSTIFKRNDDLLGRLWVEKHRPTDLKDLVLPDDQRREVSQSMLNGEIPHYMFVGPPGSGKSALSRIIVENLVHNKSDVLIMNGSDTTGVDTVRSDITGFLRTPPFASKFKIVFIDEFDFMTKNAQAMLRNVMEKYAQNGRFIVTANYKSKIVNALFSRFTVYEMKSMELDFVTQYLINILKVENIEYDEDSVKIIAKTFSPDVRKAVNTLQQNSVDGKLKTFDVQSMISTEKKLCGMLIQMCDDIENTARFKQIADKNGSAIIQIINSGGEPDYLSIYETLMSHEKLPLWAKIKVNEYTNKHHDCVLPQCHFMAMVYEIVVAGMVYMKNFGAKK